MLADIHRRIVSAKFVLERAASIQAERNEMSISISVLLMHDAAELLTLAVLDHMNLAPSPKRDFKEFWSLIKQATGSDAPDRIPMERLNTIRVGFKHKGALPNPIEARDLLVRTKGFFDNVLTRYCGESYDSISLIDLVPDADIRRLIAGARQEFLDGDKNHAMYHLQIAFHDLRQPKDKVIPGIQAPRIPMLPSELKQSGWGDYLKSLHTFMETSATATNALALGIEPLRYVNFVNMGPVIQWTMAGTTHATYGRSYDDLTTERFDELISLLIDYALKVSEVYVARTVHRSSNFAPHWERIDDPRGIPAQTTYGLDGGGPASGEGLQSIWQSAPTETSRDEKDSQTGKSL